MPSPVALAWLPLAALVIALIVRPDLASADRHDRPASGEHPAELHADVLTPATPVLVEQVTTADAAAASDAGAMLDAATAPLAVAITDAGAAGPGDAGAHISAAEPAHHGPPRLVTARIARVVIGLIALLALAIIAGHPVVRGLERRAGMSMFAATGLPFLALGAFAKLPSVGILSDDIVSELRPVLEFGLGWIGYRVGSEFDVREMDRLPRGAGQVLATESAAAFLATGLATMAALAMIGGDDVHRGGFIRDGLILAACAAVSAPSGARALESMGALTEHGSRLIRKIVGFDDGVAILVIAIVTSIFRPAEGAHWRVPAVGWMFLQIGMGAALGMFTIAVVRAARNASEELALTLGAIAFASGMAGYFALSPLAVGCVAGIVVVNLTEGRGGGKFAQQLKDLERPIYMAFFAIAGAMWEVRDWRGWIIVPVFVAARLLGKLGGARAAYIAERADIESDRARRARDAESMEKEAAFTPRPLTRPLSLIPISSLPDARTLSIAMIPTSAVSIAVIISARQSYTSSIAPYLATVVIVGAIATEVIFQFTMAFKRPPAATEAPPHLPAIVPGPPGGFASQDPVEAPERPMTTARPAIQAPPLESPSAENQTASVEPDKDVEASDKEPS